MKLLIVEDDTSLARYVVQGLREEGYAVDTALTVTEAKQDAFHTHYDLVVLDLMLPDGYGLDLLTEWRARGLQVPVLILTARDSVDDRVIGLDAGGDDYLTKPFEFEELLARIRSLLRRRPVQPAKVLTVGELRLDRAQHVAEVHGQALELTAKEFDVLECLLSNAGKVLSREEIAESAWDCLYDPRTNVIDVLVSRLRKKIHGLGGRRSIQTVKGQGYVLKGADEVAD